MAALEQKHRPPTQGHIETKWQLHPVESWSDPVGVSGSHTASLTCEGGCIESQQVHKPMDP